MAGWPYQSKGQVEFPPFLLSHNRAANQGETGKYGLAFCWGSLEGGGVACVVMRPHQSDADYHINPINSSLETESAEARQRPDRPNGFTVIWSSPVASPSAVARCKTVSSLTGQSGSSALMFFRPPSSFSSCEGGRNETCQLLFC